MYYGEMDGVLTLVALLSLAIYIGVIVAATVIASRKGRSAIGWCFLTIIFPIAILFVAIAAPANAYVQQPPSSHPNPPTTASAISSIETGQVTDEPVHPTADTNQRDAQILGLLRQNPMIFGFLAFIPFAYSMTAYGFSFRLNLVDVYGVNFLYYFGFETTLKPFYCLLSMPSENIVTPTQ